MLRAPADAAESSLRHTALPPPTSDNLVTVGALPPVVFTFQEAVERLKGH